MTLWLKYEYTYPGFGLDKSLVKAVARSSLKYNPCMQQVLQEENPPNNTANTERYKALKQNGMC